MRQLNGRELLEYIANLRAEMEAEGKRYTHQAAANRLGLRYKTLEARLWRARAGQKKEEEGDALPLPEEEADTSEQIHQERDNNH